MRKTTKPLDIETFNHLVGLIPTNIDFKTMVSIKERIRLCSSCIYLAKDFKCAKCDCSFNKKLFDLAKHCPIRKF